MRLLPMIGLLGALAVGAAGCKTVYEPIVVDGEVRAGVVTPPTAGPFDRQIPAEAVPGDPGKFVIYRARRTVDWDKVGDVTGDVIGGVGLALLYTAEISLRVAAACVCR